VTSPPGSGGRTAEGSPPQAAPSALLAIVVLTSMNLLNYIDRYVASAVKELFKRDLHFTDFQTSAPFTGLIIVYMLTSPLFSSLSDRFSRKRLIAAGVALWSLATAAAAWATGFVTFLVARSLVGVGEAAYATISPALISDYFPAARRNRMLTIFYVAIPLGAALGYTLGGVLGQAHGWRAAFLMVGLPGLAASGIVLLVREPQRGAFDPGPPRALPNWPMALRTLRRTAPYVIAVLGYVAVTFAGGGMADWFPAFLIRYRGMDTAQANLIIGGAAAAGGLGGTLCGGLLADWMRTRAWTKAPYFALSSMAMMPAAGFAILALTLRVAPVIAIAVFLAQFFLWFYNGPINTIIVNSVAYDMRARAIGLSILCIHLFGDAFSPSVIGVISDHTGNLMNGMVLIPITILVGAAVWGYGWRRLPAVVGTEIGHA
jgi:predicted MFS family arabinose efflux permease